MPEIIAIDADPLMNTSWKDADDPWNFLAVCFEIAAFHREGYGFVSHIAVALDATNSGLQIYSAMLRDSVGAAATNVSPQERPADVYKDVAENTERKLAEDILNDTEDSQFAKVWLEMGVDRTLTKKPTMCLVYSSTLFSCRDYVRDTLNERIQSGKLINPFGKDEDAFIKGVFYLAKVIWSSIGECVVSAQTCMDWMQKIARDVSKLQIPIMWQTPSGFKVVQQYPEYKTLRIQTHIDGHMMRPRLSSPDYQKVDKKRAASGLCPNFIHSLDSSFLILTVLRCQKENPNLSGYWMIHDSFSTTAKHSATLARCLREEYVRMFTEFDVVNDFRLEMLKCIPEVALPPSRGSLDLKGVIESKYFFS
jgi:DNA-directed RNA polymerase